MAWLPEQGNHDGDGHSPLIVEQDSCQTAKHLKFARTISQMASTTYYTVRAIKYLMRDSVRMVERQPNCKIPVAIWIIPESIIKRSE
jgi:hypothetical protein